MDDKPNRIHRRRQENEKNSKTWELSTRTKNSENAGYYYQKTRLRYFVFENLEYFFFFGLVDSLHCEIRDNAFEIKIVKPQDKNASNPFRS